MEQYVMEMTAQTKCTINSFNRTIAQISPLCSRENYTKNAGEAFSTSATSNAGHGIENAWTSASTIRERTRRDGRVPLMRAHHYTPLYFLGNIACIIQARFLFN